MKVTGSKVKDVLFGDYDYKFLCMVRDANAKCWLANAHCNVVAPLINKSAVLLCSSTVLSKRRTKLTTFPELVQCLILCTMR